MHVTGTVVRIEHASEGGGEAGFVMAEQESDPFVSVSSLFSSAFGPKRVQWWSFRIIKCIKRFDAHQQCSYVCLMLSDEHNE